MPSIWSMLQLCWHWISWLCQISIPAQSKYGCVKDPTVALMSLPSLCVHSCSLFRSYWALGWKSVHYIPPPAFSFSCLYVHLFCPCTQNVWRILTFAWHKRFSNSSQQLQHKSPDVAVAEADLRHSALRDEHNQIIFLFVHPQEIPSTVWLAPLKRC